MDALVEAAPNYPISWSTDAWEVADGAHWAAGFAVAMGNAPPVAVPEGARVGGFSGFSGYYGRAAGLADQIRMAMLPCGAIGVSEVDLTEAGGEAYIDAVGPTAALIGPLDPELAARHAHWTLQALQQPDGSVLQIARFDPESGRLLGRRTGRQGLHSTSRWSRAQAWGLLAGVMAAPFADGTRWDVGENGRKLAAWWMDHADPDTLPPWDFDARGGPRDSSAGAIAAAALHRMAGAEPDCGRRREVRDYADRLTSTLERSTDTRGALLHGCYDLSLGLATDAELIWGDHYLLEVLEGR